MVKFNAFQLFTCWQKWFLRFGILFSIWACTGGHSSPLIAQTSLDPITLNMEEAQNMALQKNHLLQSSKKSVQKSEHRLTDARSRFMPDISAYANYTHNFERPIFTINLMGQSQTVRMGTEENIATGVQINQPLYLGGAVRSGYEMAQLHSTVAENRHTLQRQHVLLQVRRAFYQAIYTQQLIGVAEEALRNAERNLDIVKRRADLGTASGFDIMRAEVRVSNARPRLIAARHQHVQALTALRTAIGLEPEQPVRIHGSFQPPQFTWADTSVRELQQRAYRRRIELKNMRIQKQIQQKNLAVARSSLLPRISASTALQYQLQDENIVLASDKYFRSIAGGITFSVPLFTGWETKASIAVAQVNLKQITDEHRQLKQQVAAEVETAFQSLVQAEEQLMAQQKTVTQARKSLELAEISFKEGTATQLDILNAQLALQQSQTNTSQYLLQYYIARDQLLKATNQLSID